MTTISHVGVWSLESFDAFFRDTGLSQPVFGESPRGRAILTESGFASFLLLNPDRTPPVDAAGFQQIYASTIAYSGTYRIEGDELITDPDLAWDPAWIDTPQPRQLSFEGEKLVLTTPWQESPLNPEEQLRAVLKWVKESDL